MYKAISGLLFSLALTSAGVAAPDPPAPAGTEQFDQASDDELAASLGRYRDPTDKKADFREDFRLIQRMLENHQVAEAIARLTALITAHPDREEPLVMRARAHAMVGDNDRALADAAAALKIERKALDARELRAAIFRSRGMPAAALAEAAALEKSGGGLPAHMAAGRIYSAFGEYAKSARAFDRAMGIYEQSAIYIYRSLSRPRTDLAGREADLAKALELMPAENVTPFSKMAFYEAKGELLRSAGDPAGSIEAYSSGLAINRTSATMLTGRGISLALAGRTAEAETDFALARANAFNEAMFNNMCWEKAKAGVALSSALEECNIAIAGALVRAPFLDSRALVLLRLGRLDDAIRDYDEALATDLRLASSYLGRAIAWSRKGDAAKAAADLAAARRSNPNIENEFAFYGITLP